MKISALAGQAGLRPDTLRYYEQLGLLPAPERSKAGYRLFGEETIDRLRFIKGAQSLGLRLADIRELLEIRDRGACPCGHTEALLRERVAAVDAELRRLREVRVELVRLIDDHPASSCTVTSGPWWCEREFSERR